METTFDEKAYVAREYGTLVGAKIIGVRTLTASELELMGWADGYSSEVALMLILDDGRALIPSMDSEGNGAGHLFVEKLG
jgi:hypothetical protein